MEVIERFVIFLMGFGSASAIWLLAWFCASFEDPVRKRGRK